MLLKEFINLLQHPGQITSGQTKALENILEQAPYFQAARAIKLKGLKEHQAFSYNSALKKTAAYTTDRSVLFDFITSKEFNQNQIAAQIKEQEKRLQDLTVYEPQEIFGKRSIAIDDAIKMKKWESEQILNPGLFEKNIPETHKETEASEEASSEEKLNMGEPLEFDASESHSFSEWLKLTSAKPIKREQDAALEEKMKSKKFELIDEFISKNPKIKPLKNSNRINLAEEQNTPESLMTETLARVYLEQKNYKKAIQAYKILILKNPEKSGSFADQIRAIEKIQEKNNTN